MEILCSKSEKSMWPPPVILGLTCCMTRLGNSLGLTDKCSSGRGWVGATGSPRSSTRGGGAWPLFSFSPAHPSTATSTWTGSVQNSTYSLVFAVIPKIKGQFSRDSPYDFCYRTETFEILQPRKFYVHIRNQNPIFYINMQLIFNLPTLYYFLLLHRSLQYIGAVYKPRGQNFGQF